MLTMRSNLETNRMSTMCQRGVSGVDAGSKYRDPWSHAVKSGYAFLTTSAIPTTPGGFAAEW